MREPSISDSDLIELEPLASSFPPKRSYLHAVAASLVGIIGVVAVGSASFATASAATGTSTAGELAATPRTSFVTIVSQPKGADVLVGGAKMGVAPMTLVLPPGAHEIAIAKAGYDEKTVRVDVPPYRRAPVLETVVLARDRANRSNESFEADEP